MRPSDVHRAVHLIYFYSKTNQMHQCIKFILFWNDTLHVSDGLSVHHQQFKTVHTATGICQTDTAVWFASKQIAVLRWDGHVARIGEERGVYRVLVGKPEGRRPLGRPRCRWVDNIRMDLQEVGCGYMDWIGLAQDRDRGRTLVSAVMNLRVP